MAPSHSPTNALAPTRRWAALLALLGLAGCANVDRGLPDDGREHTVSFLVSEIRVPEPSDGEHLRGFDLDGIDSSTGVGESCSAMAWDYSWDDEHGVDARLNEIASAYSLISEGERSAGTELNLAIDEERLLLVVQVRGVTHSGDGPVEVALLAGAADSALEHDAGGHPRPGQSLRATELAVVEGSIEGTRVHARFESLSIPVEGGVPLLPLTGLGPTELAFDVVRGASSPELGDGVLGTSLSIEAMADDFAARSADPQARELMLDVLTNLADMSPSADDPMMCSHVSLLLELDAVPVTIE